MKKIMWSFAVMVALGLPASAAVQFYRAENGEIVAEMTQCQDAARVADLLGLPDDPPGGSSDDEEKTGEVLSEDVAKGITTLAGAVLTDDPTGPKTSIGISREVEHLLDATNFEERQDAFITFVRDVNWKTGMHITFRDYSFFRRLKMACSGINQMTKPMRINLGVYAESIDQTINQLADAGVDKLAQAAREHSFNAMSKLSIVGLAIAIEKENPFLLLAMDEETYGKLVAYEPKIAELFEDMYMFFNIRSVRMGEFNRNIKALIDVAKIGHGDSFSTWHVMSEYAKKMLELERQGKLNPEDELQIHIWRLESSMHYIKEHVRVEKRAAELAAQNPQNTALIQKINEGPKKKPSLDDKARELLKKSTQAEIEHMLRKYITK